MNLFETIQEARVLQNLVDTYAENNEGDITDVSMIIDSWAQEYSIEKKLESIGYVLRELEAQSEAMQKEEKRLKEKRQVNEAKVERLKEWTKFCLERNNINKICAGLFDFSINKSQPTVQLTGDVPDEFMRIKKEPDKTLIAQKLKAGEEMEFAKLVHNTHLRIK